MSNQLSFLTSLLVAIFTLGNFQFAKAQEAVPSEADIDSMTSILDSMKNSLQYQTGKITLPGEMATLDLPKGFKFLDAKQSSYVITELWGNPSADGTLGMVLQENATPFDEESWAFIVTYDAIGYVKDNDADKINYDDLLKEMKEDAATESIERAKMGYEAIELVGWAAKPFYDKDKKVLHWAKEIKFGDASETVLNYNVRVLGRKGVLVLNAVASTKQLPEVNKHIDAVVNMIAFNNGSKYADFDPKIDQVAAYTIGGLVAGKVLLKVGFFAVLLKFSKIIIVGLIALGAGIWRFLSGRQKQDPNKPNPTDLNG